MGEPFVLPAFDLLGPGAGSGEEGGDCHEADDRQKQVVDIAGEQVQVEVQHSCHRHRDHGEQPPKQHIANLDAALIQVQNAQNEEQQASDDADALTDDPSKIRRAEEAKGGGNDDQHQVVLHGAAGQASQQVIKGIQSCLL